MSEILGDPDDVKIEYFNGTLPITYECERLVSNNEFPDEEVTFFYELIYNRTSLDFDTARRTFESNLLTLVSEDFGLVSGMACSEPVDITSPWIVRISSEPEDEESLTLQRCIRLVPDPVDEVCVPFLGRMTAHFIGPNDPDALLQSIEAEIISGAVTENSSALDASFLGTSINATTVDSGRDNLNPSSNENDTTEGLVSGDRQTITPIGVLMALGLAMGLVGIVFIVLALRRRRRNEMSQEEMIMAASSHELDYDNDLPPSRRDPRDSHTRSTLQEEPYNNNNINPNSRRHGARDPYSYQTRGAMGDKTRNDMYGAHAHGVHINPATGRYQHPRESVESESESDVDSWAQPGATLGAIDQRLEPITAEV